MENSNEFMLCQKIIDLSNAKVWKLAKLEWSLVEVYREEEPDTCLCGHFPINEICILRNKYNDNTATVGNVCVNKFIGLPSELILQGLKRIANDPQKALNKETTCYAYDKGWINDYEYKFCQDTRRKRKMTEAQMDKRESINKKIIRNMARKRQR